jgi:hypothetical protein
MRAGRVSAGHAQPSCPIPVNPAARSTRAQLAVIPTEGDGAGVRPFSGRASSGPPNSLESSKTPPLADAAASGDGSAPMLDGQGRDASILL